ITEKSPAAKAGLQKGDVVTALDNKPVANYVQLVERILTHHAGDKVVLKVVRGKDTKEITVTLENRPLPPRPSGVFLGVATKDVSAGVQLTQVAPEGPAAKAGLKAGDVILAVDKKKVATLRQLTEALRGRKAGDKVTLQVLQGKDTRDIVITVARRRVR